MGHSLLRVMSFFLLNTLLYYGHAEDAALTINPKWSTYFDGEYVTFICDMKEGEDTDWWYKMEQNRNELYPYGLYNGFRFSVSTGYSGDHQCFGVHKTSRKKKQSNIISLIVSTNRPKAKLTASSTSISVGGSVTLTCSVDVSVGWKYYWYRGTSVSADTLIKIDGEGNRVISVSQGGIYGCRGGRGDPVFFTDISDVVTITLSNVVTVTLNHKWPQIFRGETITVTCDIQDKGDTEWEYEWRTTSSTKPRKRKEYKIHFAIPNHSGNYECKGRRKSDQSPTKWSDPISLTVSDQPRPNITVSPSWLSPGASVTLKCEVEHPSAGWSFYWYKTVPDTSKSYVSYDYELLPGSTNGTEQDSYIIHGQTHTAGYVCRAGRGDPVYHTDYSEPKFVWSGDSHSAASLTVTPDSVQHFNSDTVSLSCERNFTEWRVMKFTDRGNLLSCSSFGAMTESTCNFQPVSDSVYWCESGSGQFSDAVNISAHYGSVILESPVHPVTEGQSLTLGCKMKKQNDPSAVFFYKNNKLIQTDGEHELTIPAVSKSHEGFYKCTAVNSQFGQQNLTSAESWISVKSATHSNTENHLFPVVLIVGSVCGLLLFLLLLLLFYYRSKGSCSIRSQRTYQTDHAIDQSDTQHQENTSLHGDACVYETINDLGHNEFDGFSDVTYTSVELKKLPKNGENHEPGERCIYSGVKTSASAAGDSEMYAQVNVQNEDKTEKIEDDSAMYAQVNVRNKGQTKKNKEETAPDESFYSEVKQGTAYDQ